MTTTLAASTAEELDALYDASDDDDIVHWTRPCDPDTALCGLHLPGDCFVEDDEANGPPCPECLAIDRAGDREHLAGCAVCRDAEEEQ